MINRHIITISSEITFQVLWFLFFVNAFSCFVRIPARIFVDISSGLFIGFLLIHYGYEWFRAIKTHKLKFITLFMIPLLLMPMISALQAEQVFGQPVLYGFLAQRQVFMVLCGHFIVIALQRNWVSIKDFERYLIRSLLILLLTFLLFYMFVDSKQFANTDFITLSPNKGLRYEFPDSCIYALLLYALFKLWIDRKKKWLIIIALCTFYILAYLLDRTQLIAIIGTIGLYVLLNFKIGRMIRMLTLGTFGLLFVFLILNLMVPDFLSKNISLYVGAFETLAGEKLTESSTNIRFLESKIALDGFNNHPVIGVGFLSTRWNEGFRMVNKYFYPTDVGILGNLYVYGIIGTLIFYLPFFYSFLYRKRLRKNKTALLVTSQYIMIFFFADMLTAATNQKFYGVISVFFGILYYHRFNQETTD